MAQWQRARLWYQRSQVRIHLGLNFKCASHVLRVCPSFSFIYLFSTRPGKNGNTLASHQLRSFCATLIRSSGFYGIGCSFLRALQPYTRICSVSLYKGVSDAASMSRFFVSLNFDPCVELKISIYNRWCSIVVGMCRPYAKGCGFETHSRQSFFNFFKNARLWQILI